MGETRAIKAKPTGTRHLQRLIDATRQLKFTSPNGEISGFPVRVSAID